MNKQREKFERGALALFSKAAWITFRATKACADGEFRTAHTGIAQAVGLQQSGAGAPSKVWARLGRVGEKIGKSAIGAAMNYSPMETAFSRMLTEALELAPAGRRLDRHPGGAG